MKKIILLYAFLLCLIMVKAQTASIEKFWLEHNVTENGVAGINVHLKFNIQGMKGQNGRVIAYFDSPQGTGVKDLNDKYCTVDGTVCTSKDFCCPYENTLYSDFSIFIPVEELHMKPGKHTYYCRAFIQNLNTQSFITHSEFVSFNGTGNDNQSVNNGNIAKTFPAKQKFFFTNSKHSGILSANFYYDKQNEPVCEISTGATLQYYWWGSNSDHALEFYGFEYKPETKAQNSFNGGPPIISYTGNVVKARNSFTFSLSPDYSRLTLNGNLFDKRISYEQYQTLWDLMYGNNGGTPTINNPKSNSFGSGENNTSNQNQDNRCKYCRGTGNCSSCKGKGYKFNSYSGHNDTCPSCNGTTRCFNCHGTGKQR